MIASEESGEYKTQFRAAIAAIFDLDDATLQKLVYFHENVNFLDPDSIGRALVAAAEGESGRVILDATAGNAMFSLAMTPELMKEREVYIFYRNPFGEKCLRVKIQTEEKSNLHSGRSPRS